MKSWLKYGFLSAGSYVFVIAILIAIFHCINSASGSQTINNDNRLFYALVAAAGLVMAFLAGFCFRPILARMTSRYSLEYPDIPVEDIRYLCREKLLVQYFGILTCGCFLPAIAMVGVLDSYPEMVCTLSGGGFSFAYRYFQCRNRYKHLCREYRKHYDFETV